MKVKVHANKNSKMAVDGPAVKEEEINALTREAESLKIKLEEERRKLNDVDCKYSVLWIFVVSASNVFLGMSSGGHISPPDSFYFLHYSCR